MNVRTQLTVLLLAIFCNANASFLLKSGKVVPDPAAYELRDFSFTENKGQIYRQDGQPSQKVKFSLQQENLTLFLLDDGIAYQFRRVQYPEGYPETRRAGMRAPEQISKPENAVLTETFRMDMTLVGANTRCEISTAGRSEDHTNYYYRKVFDVHGYTKITFHNIYPGIDWVVYTKGKEIKYDFVLHPGADPSIIKMHFSHQRNIELGPHGDLMITNDLGQVIEKNPYSYQGSRSISTKFKLNGNTVTFDIGKYDSGNELVIDPALVWSTYYGGAGIETGMACASDANGNVYLAGETNSNSNLIAQGGYQVTFGGGVDAFLAKFNSNGVRQWGTYYGGVGNDYGLSCATDRSGAVYLSGRTSSGSGIASAGHQINFAGGNFDGFLAKFSTAGSLLWATYYGGSGTEECVCSTDTMGNVYLAGSTTSTAGIALGGHQNTIGGGYDAFLAKFNSAGLRQWGTYIGGANTDNGTACSTDASGNVYMSGATTSPAGIAAGGHQNTIGGIGDAFLVKFNTAGVRQWGTYYGGTGDDVGRSCATDTGGAVYLAGYAASTSGIASGGYQNLHGGGSFDAFLVKFNSAGTRQWGTYYGSAGYEDGQCCATDLAGNVFLQGNTTSSTGIASGILQSTFGGGQFDAYLVKFNSSGIRIWATYFGGNDDDIGLFCSTDAAGNVHLQGQTKSTSGIASGGHQNAYSGGGDAFLAKICNEPGIPGFISGSATVCAGEEHLYTIDEVIFASAYIWSFSGNSSGNSATNSILITPSGSGTITVAAQNACGTGQQQSKALTVETCLGISRQSENIHALTVFPNPCSNEFFITSQEQGELKIYDTSGNLILSCSFFPGTNRIEFGPQRSGLYMLEINASGHVAGSRLVISSD